MMDETAMGGGHKWLVVGLRERERRGIKKKLIPQSNYR